MKHNKHRRPLISSLLAIVAGIFLARPCHCFLWRTSRRSPVVTTTTISGRSLRNASPGLQLLVVGMVDPLAVSIEDRASARSLVFQGMEAFRRGDVAGSIQCFDQAERVQGPSLTPFLWQRGLSFYYADEFDLASKQFRTDVQVNPSDVEEIVWDIASQLRTMNPAAQQFPVPSQMALPPGIRDRRRIMPTVYRLFRGEATEHELAVAGHSIGASIADEFYALFYLGLYCEARGESSKAAVYMQQAAATEYATGVGRGDYMTTCARIHCRLRGWTPN